MIPPDPAQAAHLDSEAAARYVFCIGGARPPVSSKCRAYPLICALSWGRLNSSAHLQVVRRFGQGPWPETRDRGKSQTLDECHKTHNNDAT